MAREEEARLQREIEEQEQEQLKEQKKQEVKCQQKSNLVNKSQTFTLDKFTLFFYPPFFSHCKKFQVNKSQTIFFSCPLFFLTMKNSSQRKSKGLTFLGT